MSEKKICLKYRGKYIREISDKERGPGFDYRWIALVEEGKLCHTLQEAAERIDYLLDREPQHAA